MNRMNIEDWKQKCLNQQLKIIAMEETIADLVDTATGWKSLYESAVRAMEDIRNG